MTEYRISMSSHYRAESAKCYRRFIMFGFLLLMAHLLDLQPQKYTGFGLSIDVKKQVYLYGFLATIVIYEFFIASYYEIIGDSLFQFKRFKEVKESFYKNIKDEKSELTEDEIQSELKTQLLVLKVIMFPFFLILILIGLLSLIVATHDAYNFIGEVITVYWEQIMDKSK